MPTSVTDASPPICGAHLRHLRALTLRRGEGCSGRVDGAVLMPLFLAAPLLERVYLENAWFDAASVVALTAAVGAGIALQRMRLACIESGRDDEPEMQQAQMVQLLENLLLRMRAISPHFESGLVVNRDSERLRLFWDNHMCADL